MGYQIQAGAPQIVVNGTTYAVGAFEWQNPIGSFYKIGIYSLDVTQGWQELEAIVFSDGEVLAAVQKNGSLEKSMEQTKLYINGLFQKHVVAPPVNSEPTSETEARAMITAETNALSLTLVNGIPVMGAN